MKKTTFLVKTKTFLKKIVYNTLGKLKFRTQKLDNVLILTSSRSGSTWLNESLQNTKDFKLYNQPFDRVFNTSVYNNLLPSNKSNPYFSNLNIREYRDLISYWTYIINGDINPNVDWRFYKKKFNFFYKRKLIKSFFTKDLIDYYAEQPNLKIIYLIRNPIDRAVSNINYGYKDFGNVLLKNSVLIESKMINTQELSKIYSNSNSLITKHVISWYLENYIICNYLYSIPNNVLTIKYEDMVSKKDTEKIISLFVFGDVKFELSKKASKSTQTKHKKASNHSLNIEELHSIKDCLPNFMPYLNELS